MANICPVCDARGGKKKKSLYKVKFSTGRYIRLNSYYCKKCRRRFVNCPTHDKVDCNYCQDSGGFISRSR